MWYISLQFKKKKKQTKEKRFPFITLKEWMYVGDFNLWTVTTIYM